MTGRDDRGQAAVELALGVPLLVVLLLAVVQVVVVARDQVAVVHAAREAARAAAAYGATEADGVAAGQRASGSHGVVITVQRGGGRATATARYRSPTDIPLVGAFVGDIELTASATMALEG